jgi:hypothetical protein
LAASKLRELTTRLKILEVAMPRRTPSEIRAELSRRLSTNYAPAVIRGLSASTNHQIADFERANKLDRGDVSLAFQRWSRAARHLPCPSDSPDWPHDEDGFHGGNGQVHVRTLLENVTRAMRAGASRELRSAISAIDALYLAQTLNDPHAPAGLPWWQRRIET